ncbi:hypothetical protein N431DRAFT_468330 [Stipitochalara longipes BDJ]|nr:hypothetical protein N431DRAFT_468330 [Stipitochalara longipes BDJ]
MRSSLAFLALAITSAFALPAENPTSLNETTTLEEARNAEVDFFSSMDDCNHQRNKLPNSRVLKGSHDCIAFIPAQAIYWNTGGRTYTRLWVNPTCSNNGNDESGASLQIGRIGQSGCRDISDNKFKAIEFTF